MRKLIFLMAILIGFNYSAENVYQSLARTVNETTIVQTGMSNTALPVSLVTCGNSFLKVWAITATPTSATASISVCSSSDIRGNCSVVGDTSVSPIPVLSSTTIFIGQVLGAYSPAEITTGTKLDGDWIFHRYCVSRDYLR
jgi:hypothetical protein